MQSTPTRLSQAIWTAFQAARPIRNTRLVPRPFHSQRDFNFPPTLREWPVTQQRYVRFYSDNVKSTEVEQKVQDARERIQDSLEARAETVADAGQSLKKPSEETIVHAKPESSSIVYTKDDTQGVKSENATQSFSSPEKESKLPSQAASLRSQVTNRFSQFMDGLQTQIFVASRRLNDLTGYTGIERLKREIDIQESHVQSARQLVKSSRDKYAEAIAMRSATQREVNDLLHRKHAWSPQDLERFTSLYRSDHANEQAEQKAHQTLSDAEVRYEESSTQLAKSILARYHEEQIWSDKIRQMSTWGTWGLMGLNVLLFVVLQLAIEPWRRRRLVRGFEEKVEVALAAREQENQELRAQLNAKVAGSETGSEVIAEAVNLQSESAVGVAGEKIAESIVDAITGSTDKTATSSTSHHQNNSINDTEAIEQAVEQVTAIELQQETQKSQAILQTTQSTTLEGGEDTIGSPDIIPSPTSDTTTSSPLLSSLSSSSSQLFKTPYTWLLKSYNNLIFQFNTTDHIVLSRRDLTTRVLEGVATGIALTGSLAYLFLIRK